MSRHGAYVHHRHRGLSRGRLRHRGILVAFVAGFGLIVVVAAGASGLASPVTRPLCQPYRPCGSPPQVMRPLINATVWRSPRYGFSIEYPGDQVSVAEHDDAGLILETKLQDGSTGAIVIDGRPVGQGSLTQAISGELGGLQGVSQLATDSNPADQLLGAGVGYRTGLGATYSGDFTAPQGVGQPANLAIQGASDGHVIVAVTVVGAAPDARPDAFLYQIADQIINSVRWPGGA